MANFSTDNAAMEMATSPSVDDAVYTIVLSIVKDEGWNVDGNMIDLYEINGRSVLVLL